MIKKFFAVLLVSLGIWWGPSTTSAATTISLVPSASTLKPGQRLTLRVMADSQSLTNYTVKASLKFSSGVLRLSTWTFSPGWLPLRQAGYDSFDNQSGTLVRTAGYPEGFTGPVEIGRAVFVAQAPGVAKVSVAADSLALNEASENVFSGASAISVIVTKPPIEVPEPVEVVEKFYNLNLSLARSVLAFAEPIRARVDFEGFSTSSAPVELAFTISTLKNEVVCQASALAEIGTIPWYEKTFAGSTVAPGHYFLRVSARTDDWYQERTQPFEIVPPAVAATEPPIPWWPFVVGPVLLCLGLILSWLWFGQSRT